jgi:hypothetical protein
MGVRDGTSPKNAFDIKHWRDLDHPIFRKQKPPFDPVSSPASGNLSLHPPGLSLVSLHPSLSSSRTNRAAASAPQFPAIPALSHRWSGLQMSGDSLLPLHLDLEAPTDEGRAGAYAPGSQRHSRARSRGHTRHDEQPRAGASELHAWVVNRDDQGSTTAALCNGRGRRDGCG